MRRVVAGVVLGLLALAPPAYAVDPTFDVTVSPSTVAYPDTKELTYRVRVTTGAEAERFALKADGTPAFFGFGGQPEGALLVPGTAVLEGPGTLVPTLSLHGDTFCAHHGSLLYSYWYDIELPANSVSTVVLTARVASDAPWPGEQYRLVLTATAPTRGSPSTLEAQHSLAAPVIPVSGRTGVRLSIATDAPSGSGCGARLTPNPGVPITITGRSDPSLAGQQVGIEFVKRGRNGQPDVGPVGLGTVPVSGDGTFVLRDWRPQEVGAYTVAARYISALPHLADDYSLSLGFELTAPVPLVAPVRLPAVVTRATARRGVARLVLRCPASPTPCRGTLRLWSSERGEVAGPRSFAIPAGQEAVLSVALRRGARRALRRAKRLRADVVIRAGNVRSRTLVVIRGS